MNTFYVYFADGYSEKMEFPTDWTQEDILKQTGAVEIMFVCYVDFL